jgi:hypothetical protein
MSFIRRFLPWRAYERSIRGFFKLDDGKKHEERFLHTSGEA